ncbi:MAG: segregation/condensation protein A [Clostridiales bacterium]|nr:segregation/condensation protein A [Clostridiales bacterium]
MTLQLKINEFEGPFDVLLHLIERDEMDIYNIQIHKITSGYISYIENMKEIDMEIAAEFIVMASILIEIKSMMLLPDHKLEPLDFENEEDPRYELITKLMEYKKYKELSKKISNKKIDDSIVFIDETNVYQDTRYLEEDYKNMSYDIDLLREAFEKMLSNLKRFDEDKLNYFKKIKRERFPLESKVFELKELFKREKEITFMSLFSNSGILEEFITTFLAILEIIKSENIKVVQKKQFSEIILISGD